MIIDFSRRILAALLRPPEHRAVVWPNGKRFAFTVVDDTDQSTLENILPIYSLLHRLNMPITKTAWVVPTLEPGEIDNRGDSLADPEYREFLLDLQGKGFEIGFHGARGGDARRKETEAALMKFRDVLGRYPRCHVNHFKNRENLYSGRDKLSFGPLRGLYRLFQKWDFEGHVEGSPYFWGDIAKKHVSYVRDFHYDEIDVRRIYPVLPYHDPNRPWVNFWYHASDGSNRESFVKLLRRPNLERLEEAGGLCIVYTHFGKGFCHDDAVDRAVADRLEDVAGRPGWFAPVGVILDFLRGELGEHTLTHSNRVFMELSWVVEKAFRGRT
ncbi:MAG: hypothetical protein KKA42_08300 [candidate division Zixibacteria bacterium]|nr:hypothetical protein [candidate division Zixibacteria bacterium]